MNNSMLDMLTPEQRRCVPDVSFELIPIKNLVSNQDYQRPLSENHIRKAAEEFDVDQLNLVKVSRRDGQNFIIDGQHTCLIVQTVSGSNETPVWCMIYEDMKYTEEAHLFADQKKHVKPLTPYEIFAAHIEAKDAKQMMIKSITDSYGITITGRRMSSNHICAVSMLEKIYDQYGSGVLDRVLRLAIGTWEGAVNSMSATMLLAIAKLVAAYGDKLRDDVFKENVGMCTVRSIVRSGKEIRPGAMGIAFALINAYNGKRKVNRLDPKGLFGGRKVIREESDEETSESHNNAPQEASDSHDNTPQKTSGTQDNTPQEASESQGNASQEAETVQQEEQH